MSNVELSIETASGKHLSFGKPDDSWKQYNLRTAPIFYGGVASPYRGILRSDALVAIVKKNYLLFPNEEALKIAGEAARLANMEPFQIKEKDNWLLNEKGTRLWAMYVPKGTTHKVSYGTAGMMAHSGSANSDEVKIGITIYNNIDASSSFGIGLFTYRFACENGVITGKQDISSFRHLHTQNFAPIIKVLKEKILGIMDKGKQVMEAYALMQQEKLNLELVERLSKSKLPKTVIPDYIPLEAESIAPDLLQMDQWQLYNDITEQIWHRGTSMETKESQFNELHRIMPIIARRA